MRKLNDAESLALLNANPGLDFVVYFTASWCSVCVQTEPIAESYARDHAVALNEPMGGTTIATVRAATGPALMALDFDLSPKAAQECGVTALPALALISREPRKLIRMRQGYFDRRTLDEFAGLAPGALPPSGQAPPTLPGSSPNKPGELPLLVVLGALAAAWWWMK